MEITKLILELGVIYEQLNGTKGKLQNLIDSIAPEDNISGDRDKIVEIKKELESRKNEIIDIVLSLSQIIIKNK